MKLHLPSGLRKALLACLAAVALPAASIPSTIASASGIAAVFLAASQRANAEAEGKITNQVGYTNALDGDNNRDGETWDLEVTESNFFFQAKKSDDQWNTTTRASLNFLRTLTVDNGSDNTTQTFEGALKGEVGCNFEFAWTGGKTNTWVFKGDLSEFKGDIVATSSTLNVTLATGAKSNVGAIKQNGGTLNLTVNGQEMKNSEINVNNLTLDADTTFTGEVTVAGLASGDGKITLADGKKLKFTSSGELDWNATGLHVDGDVEITNGATLKLRDGGHIVIEKALTGNATLRLLGGLNTNQYIELWKGGSIKGFNNEWAQTADVNHVLLGGDLIFTEKNVASGEGVSQGVANSISIERLEKSETPDTVYLIYQMGDGDSVTSLDGITGESGIFHLGGYVAFKDNVGVGLKTNQEISLTGGGSMDKDFAFIGGGTLKLDAGTYTFQKLKIDGSGLDVAGTVSAQKLTGSLTQLTLGASAKLTITDGSFGISSGWTWGEGCELILSSKGQQITLSGMETLNNSSSANPLTIHLSDDFLSGGVSGELVLFAGFQSGWESYFKIVMDEGSIYSNVNLTSEGKLTFDANTLTWKNDADSKTWDDSGANQSWGTGQAWNNGKPGIAVFNNEAGGDMITISGAVKAAGVEVQQGTVWTFKVEGENTLTVSGGITVSGSSKLTLSGDGKVSAKNVTLTDGSLELSNTDLYFSESITGDAGHLTGTGHALYTGGGSMSWADFTAKFGSDANVLGGNAGYGAAEKELTITDAVDLKKSFKADDGTTVNLNGNVTFGGGKLVLGDDANIVLGGTLTKGSGEVSVTHEGTESGKGTLTASVTNGYTFGGDYTMTFGEGVKLVVNGSTGAGDWGYVKNVTVLDELDLTGDEMVFRGTNTIEKLDASGVKRKVTLDDQNTSTTLKGNSEIGADVVLDMREGNLVIGKGSSETETTLTLRGGLTGGAGAGDTISGANLTFAGSFAAQTWGGDLSLDGTLTMSGGTQTLTGNTLSVGSLVVTNGSLTMGSTGKGMIVKTGGIDISSGAFKWAGGVLTVNGGEISVGGGATFELAYSAGSGLKLAWNGASISSPIILTLTGFADNDVSNSGYALFESGWNDGWKDKIFVTGTTTDGSKQLTLNESGCVVTLEAGTDLYWPGNGGSSQLAWGSGGNDQWAKKADEAPGHAWTTNSNVYLAATGAATVTLKDATITAASIKFTAANAGADGGYTFTSDQTSSTLLVNGDMLNFTGAGDDTDNSKVAVKATFDDKVNVHVVGNFINHGVKSEYTFKNKLVVDGQLGLWGASPNGETNASVMTLEKGAEVGELDASWSGKFVLGDDLVIGGWTFQNSGHHTWFERLGGVDKDVYVDVRTTISNLVMNGGGSTGMSFGEGVGIKSSSGTLTFGGSTTFAVGGSYAAVGGGEMVFNVDATAGMNVEIGTGSSITVKEGKKLEATGKLKGTGGTLKLESGATATFTGGVEASSSLTSLQLAEGATLTSGGVGTLDVGTLTLTGHGYISLSSTDEGKIKLDNAIDGADQHKLTITLTGLSDEGSDNLLRDGYQLFDTSMSADLLKGLKALFDNNQLAIDLGRDCTYDVTLGDDGKLSFSNDTVTLTHTGSSSEFTWDDSSNTWDSEQTFAEGNSVNFKGAGENTVKLGINATVKNMTVEATSGSYTFEAVGDYALTVRKALDLKSAATFKVGTTVDGKMSGTGALTVDTKTFTLGNETHDWKGELTVQNGGTFGLAGTVAASKLTVGASRGTVNLSGTLTVEGDIAGEGNALTLTGGGKLDWTGGTHTGALGSASIENGEFAIGEGNTLTMGGNITLGQNGKLSGSGAINKKDNDVYVQLEVVGTPESVNKTVDDWETDKLGSVKLGDGVYLQKTGAGTLSFADTGGTLHHDLEIAEGAVQFNGASYTLEGKLTGQGNFHVATAALGSNPTAKTLEMKQGGSISGDMALSGWGARLQLDADLEVGGITKLENLGLNVNAGNSDNNNRFRTVLARERGSANLTVNVAKNATKEVDGLVIEDGITLVKKGEGTQKFTTSTTTNEAGNGKTQLKGGVKVDEGVLEFEGAGSVISGALSNTDNSTSGTLKLTSGDLTLSGGGTHGGTLEMTAGTITVSTADLTVGTFKATAGTLDVQSNLTIGEGDFSSGTLTTLKIASSKKVTLKKGTLKATTLDLDGTTGAGFEIDMTGQAKLDFGAITLGTDGKLAINMTGYNNEGTYQLFELTTFSSVWNTLVTTGGKEWSEVFDITGIAGKELELDSTGLLTILDPGGMEWTGGIDGKWTDEGTSEWEGGAAPGGKDVLFTVDGAEEHGTVQIEGTVSPKDVSVASGTYIFESTGSEGGLNMTTGDDGKGGVLQVGGYSADAKLTLKLKNTAIPEIQLEDRGTLVLAHDEALPAASKIKFCGGVLDYSDTKLTDPDVSDQVANTAGGSDAAVKVSVDGTTYGSGVKWGGDKQPIGGNGGLTHALNELGIEKSGDGNFALEWKEDSNATHQGAITVTEGELQYKVHADTGTTATLSGNANVTITGESAELELTVEGTGTLEYSGTLTGDGGVSLGGGNGTIRMKGNSSAFTGEIGLGGGTVEVVGNDALGGAGTTLNINTLNQVLEGDGAIVNAGQVTVNQPATLSGVTLAGTVSGAQDLTAGADKPAGLSGNISGYSGGLKTGTSGTWKLSDKALDQTVTNAVSGSGTVQFDGDATYSGKVSDGVTLEGSSGTLTVTSTDTDNSTTAKLKGTVTLGDQETQAKWKGTELVSGTITLANVELTGSNGIGNKGTAKLYVNTATEDTKPAAAAYSLRSGEQGGIVNVNGMRGSQLDGITINEHGQLTGITGSYKADSSHKLILHFASENVGDAVGTPEALITGKDSFALDAGSKSDVELWLEGDALTGVINALAKAGGGEEASAYLQILKDGTLTMGEVALGDLKGKDVNILESLDIKEVSVEDGCIKLTGSAGDVFVAPSGPSELTDASILGEVKATVLAGAEDELTLNLDGESGDATVHNLLGVTGSQLHLQNSNEADPTGENRLEVTFDNSKATIDDKDQYPDVDGTTVEGQHTTFNGSIDGGEGVDVTKSGKGTLSVGGNYTLKDGATTITEGALELRGDENSMEGLTFEYTTAEKDGAHGEDERGLLLDGGKTTVKGEISDEGTHNKGDIVLSNDAQLELNGQSELDGTTITSGDGSGSLTLKKAEGAEEAPSLKLGGEHVAADADGEKTVLAGVDVSVQDGGELEVSGKDSAVKGSDLDVQDGSVKLTEGATTSGGSANLGKKGTLDLGSSANNQLSSLNGAEGSTLESAKGGNVTITGEDGKASVFSGSLGGSDRKEAGKLTVGKNAEVTLDNVDTGAAGGDVSKAWDVSVDAGGQLTVDLSDPSKGGQLTLRDVNLGQGNTTTFKVNTDTYNDGSITGNSLEFGKDSQVVLEAVAGDAWDNSKKLTLGAYKDGVKGDKENLDVQLKGSGFLFSDVQGVEVGKDGSVEVVLEEAKQNKFERALPKGSKNALAGATMVWDSLKNKTQFESLIDVLNDPTDYAQLVNGLITLLDNGQSAELESALGAVAGSSISVLGPALAEDLHRQLKAIRNRTTTMAGEVTYDAYDNLPIWHAWINGEGGYHKLDSDGGAPGYTLNNWGGTVGVDIDVTPQTTMGLAITAMYGDLKPSAADGATGNLDTAYLSAFLRATSGAWIHTFVVSGGLADVQLDRTVNYGAGSYHTKGSTDGYAVGAMYEVGYTRLVNKEGTVALQPVFNVEVRHASIKGYNETGSDAGLSVDDIGQDVMTFGMGARMQSIVGENAFNRTSIFEARLLVKADAGDRSGTAMNAMLHDATRAEVESAEVGAVGVEAGMGITIPLGSSSGSIFLDASVEWRKGWTSVDAAAGYRVNF